MPRVHDRGGWPTDGPIDKTDHPKADWEVRTLALNIVLGRKGIRRTDELLAELAAKLKSKGPVK